MRNKRDMDHKKEREEARVHWDTHGIDEGADGSVEELVEVKAPLSAMLSIRLSQEDVSKLKKLAQFRETGITTAARRLLHEALERPLSPIFFQALEDPKLQEALTEMFSEAQIPVEGEPTFYVLSKTALDTWARQLNETIARLLIDSFSKESLKVTPVDGVLFESLKTLEASIS